MVIDQVVLDDPPSVPLVDDDDMIEALSADRAMNRLAKAFCQGELGEVRTSVMPTLPRQRYTASPKIPSLSWIRNEVPSRTGRRPLVA